MLGSRKGKHAWFSWKNLKEGQNLEDLSLDNITMDLKEI
jgi:hypothetical protein